MSIGLTLFWIAVGVLLLGLAGIMAASKFATSG